MFRNSSTYFLYAVFSTESCSFSNVPSKVWSSVKPHMIYEDLKVAIFHVELCVFDGRHIISITRMQEKPDQKVMVDTTMMSIQ